METRKEILFKLIQFTEPVEVLSEKLRNFSWDSKESLVVLSRGNISNAIKLFLDKKITRNSFIDWANCVEMRDDIEYEVGFEKIIATILFELSIPEINDLINDDNLKNVLARLHQISN